MNLGDLRQRYRTRVDDRAVPYLWDDTDANGFLNEAVTEVAIRTRCFRDETTPSICSIPIVAGQTRYVLDPRVLEVLFAKIDGKRHDLDRCADTNFRGYRGVGMPSAFAVVLEAPNLVLILDRPPQADPPVGNLDLVVFRKALNVMEDDGDECELPDEYQIPMLHWAAALSWSTPNSDMQPAAVAKNRDDAEARFTAYFGERVSAKVARKRLRHSGPISGSAGPLTNYERLRLNRYHPSPNDPE